MNSLKAFGVGVMLAAVALGIVVPGTIADAQALAGAQEDSAGQAERSPWPMPPLVPGNWTEVSRTAPVIEPLLAATPAQYRATVQRISRLRALPLPFYPEATLYEGETTTESGQFGLLTFIRHKDGITLINGQSNPIHELNRQAPVRLDTASRAEAYLRFFTASIQGQEGIFLLVDEVGNLLGDLDTAERERVMQAVRPVAVAAKGEK